MNIYVESNFILELTFLQEQAKSCEKILSICQRKDANLVIPAFCLTEPLGKLHRQKNNRQEIQINLNAELKQLSRTSGYKTKLAQIKKLDSLFAQSIEDERKRFEKFKRQILKIGDIVSLDADIITDASVFETQYDLSPQDAIVFASVLSHLNANKGSKSCFLNRNSKDFDNPDIVKVLKTNNCKTILSFDKGVNYIENELKP